MPTLKRVVIEKSDKTPVRTPALPASKKKAAVSGSLTPLDKCLSPGGTMRARATGKTKRDSNDAKGAVKRLKMDSDEAPTTLQEDKTNVDSASKNTDSSIADGAGSVKKQKTDHLQFASASTDATTNSGQGTISKEASKEIFTPTSATSSTPSPEQKNKTRKCACSSPNCRKIAKERRKELGTPPPSMYIRDPDYKKVLSVHFNSEESKHRLNSRKAVIKLHHYKIEHRHLVFLPNGTPDQQFLLNGQYVAPGTYWEDIRQEIRLAKDIKIRDKELYENDIEKHLMGQGDGSFTLQGLREVHADTMGSNTLDSDDKNAKGIADEEYKLKDPPEKLYNLTDLQQSTTTSSSEEPKSSSQSSGECTQEIHNHLLASTNEAVSNENIDFPNTKYDESEPTLEKVCVKDSSMLLASTEEKVSFGEADSPNTDIGISNSNVAASIEEAMTEDDDLQRVLQLSKQEAADEARRLAKEEEDLQKALRLSVADSPAAGTTSGNFQSNGPEILHVSDSENTIVYSDRYESTSSLYRLWTQDEFKQFFEDWFDCQVKGGINAIEKSKFVMRGSHESDFKKSVSNPQDDALNIQRAQYGRLSSDALFHILDSLLGKANGADLPHEAKRPIKAFIDIGSGIGQQVLQAGLVYGVVSRGIEIVHNRYWLSKRLLEDCVQYFSKDPPDTSNIHIKEGNFARAFPDGTKTGVPDFKMRNFLLFNGLNGLPESERKGLVVFINNARDVFDARANDNGNNRTLDSFLAEMFGNLPVGVRFVSLESLTKCLDRKGWWREDTIKLDVDSVSWTSKPQDCYVLTKLKDCWTCQCGCDIHAVDTAGRLQVECLYECGFLPVRQTRRKKAGENKKYTEDK